MNSPISFQISSYYNNFMNYHVSIAYFLRGLEGGGSNILWKLRISASLRLLAVLSQMENGEIGITEVSFLR